MNAVRRIFGEIFFRDNASPALDKLNSKMSQAGQMAKGINASLGSFAGLSFVKGAIGITKSMLDVSASFEQTSIAMEVMTGDAETAQNLLKNIDDMSLETPFTPEALTENAKLLLNFGSAAEEIVPTLKMLGDVSAGNQDKLNRMSLAFAQVQSQGRLMGQDLLQMINAGFNPLQTISKKTGKSIKQLKQEMEKGAISFEMVQDAFKIATSSGGQFFEMMKKQSGTWEGLMSTIEGFKNAIYRIIGDIIRDKLKPLLLTTIDLAAGFVKWAKTARGIATIKIGLIALSTVIGVVLVGALTAAIIAAHNLNIALLPIIAIPLAIAAAVTAIVLIVDDLMGYFSGKDSLIIPFFEERWKEIIEEFKADCEIIKNIFLSIPDAVTEAFRNLGVVIMNSMKEVWKSITGYIPEGIMTKLGIEPVKPIKGMAQGGQLRQGESAIVGEEGPEFFTAGRAGRITPMNQAINQKQNKISINTLVGTINITVENAKEGAEQIKNIIMDALNDLSSNIFPAEMGIAL